MLAGLTGLLGGGGGGGGTAFESIATASGSAATNVTFNSIPSTYKHLQIRGIINVLSATAAKFQFNGDTGNNYAVHNLYGNGSTVSANGTANRTIIDLGRNVNFPSDTNTYGVFVFDVLDYASTTKYKTTRSIQGTNTNGDGALGIDLESGLWMNTSAITSINLNWTFLGGSQTSIALYGIKG
jgi:hypothetical protein